MSNCNKCYKAVMRCITVLLAIQASVSHGLIDGNYTITAAGGACKGVYLAYRQYGKNYPGKVFLKPAVNGKPPPGSLWTLINNPKTGDISLKAANRASCCPAKLAYAKDCSSKLSVFLSKTALMRWNTTKRANSEYYLDSPARPGCHNVSRRLTPLCLTSSVELALIGASQKLKWRFSKVPCNSSNCSLPSVVVPSAPTPSPPLLNLSTIALPIEILFIPSVAITEVEGLSPMIDALTRTYEEFFELPQRSLRFELKYIYARTREDVQAPLGRYAEALTQSMTPAELAQALKGAAVFVVQRVPVVLIVAGTFYLSYEGTTYLIEKGAEKYVEWESGQRQYKIETSPSSSGTVSPSAKSVSSAAITNIQTSVGLAQANIVFPLTKSYTAATINCMQDNLKAKGLFKFLSDVSWEIKLARLTADLLQLLFTGNSMSFDDRVSRLSEILLKDFWLQDIFLNNVHDQLVETMAIVNECIFKNLLMKVMEHAYYWQQVLNDTDQMLMSVGKVTTAAKQYSETTQFPLWGDFIESLFKNVDSKTMVDPKNTIFDRNSNDLSKLKDQLERISNAALKKAQEEVTNIIHPPCSEPDLCRKSKGIMVWKLQGCLIKLGYSIPSGVDGVFGPETEAALLAFKAKEFPGQTMSKIALADNTVRDRFSSKGCQIPTAHPTCADPTLCWAKRNDKVVQLQTCLKDRVHTTTEVDGQFGPETEVAVLKFQKKMGFSDAGQDAQVGATTKEYLAYDGCEAFMVCSDPNLCVGSRGTMVKSLHQCLINNGYHIRSQFSDSSYYTSELFDPDTKSAVVNFQKNKGLPANGVVDASTKEKLGEFCAAFYVSKCKSCSGSDSSPDVERQVLVTPSDLLEYSGLAYYSTPCQDQTPKGRLLKCSIFLFTGAKSKSTCAEKGHDYCFAQILFQGTKYWLPNYSCTEEGVGDYEYFNDPAKSACPAAKCSYCDSMNPLPDQNSNLPERQIVRGPTNWNDKLTFYEFTSICTDKQTAGQVNKCDVVEFSGIKSQCNDGTCYALVRGILGTILDDFYWLPNYKCAEEYQQTYSYLSSNIPDSGCSECPNENYLACASATLPQGDDDGSRVVLADAGLNYRTDSCTEAGTLEKCGKFNWTGQRKKILCDGSSKCYAEIAITGDTTKYWIPEWDCGTGLISTSYGTPSSPNTHAKCPSPNDVTISPAEVSEETTASAESKDFKITNTITLGIGVPVGDVVFLSDTTGSLGAAIDNVKDNALSLITSISASIDDVKFAVAQYKDEGDDFIYKVDAPLTSNKADVIAAINSWSATGGGDTPEGQLYALHCIATGDCSPNPIVFRENAVRVIIWFGDAEGHDPSSAISELQATNALVESKARVIAIDLGSLDSTGQATRITSATGGLLTKTLDPDELSKSIIQSNKDLSRTVKLSSDCGSPLVFAFDPESRVVVGSDAAAEVTFTETITLTANAAPGLYTCNVRVFINDVAIDAAVQTIRIQVK